MLLQVPGGDLGILEMLVEVPRVVNYKLISFYNIEWIKLCGYKFFVLHNEST